MNYYEVDIFEETKPAANPYHLFVQIYYPDESFREYIYQVCVQKQVSIYETYDPMLRFLRKPSFVIYLDRLELIMKQFKKMFNPNLASPLDLTEPIEYQFETPKARERFKKMFMKQVEWFFKKEILKYEKIQKEIYR